MTNLNVFAKKAAAGDPGTPKIGRKSVKYRWFYLGIITLIALIVLAAVYSLVEPYLIESKVITITSRDLPPQFENTKIIFITDIHHGPFFKLARVRKLVRRVQAQKPDLILLGGDYIEFGPQYIRPCFQELQNLQAPLGVFGVLGNHDHLHDAALTKRMMQSAGITCLDNRAVWLNKAGGRIKLGGVGDYFTDTQDLRPTLNGVRMKDFVILVTHNPDYCEALTTTKVDLVLSGHTHGGQVTCFGLWAPVIPSRFGQKFRTGVIKLPTTTVIVSNGIGTATLPIRFFARPQLLTVVLRRR
jgi:predicted MPP superfamily phosphohydrolase